MSCTEDSAKIKGGNCNTPRSSPFSIVMMFIYVYRLVSQMFISWKDYMFIRPKSLDAKANEPNFVYVIIQIINKNTSLCVDRPQRKSYGGLSSTRKGKGRGMRG
jgi:hypothetical protein